MDAVLKAANSALMEGNRDEVLRLLNGCEPSAAVLWLQAHSVEDEKQCRSLLQRVFNTDDPVYSPLAREIIERERYYEEQLSQPPDYQFWKQPTWKARFQRLKEQKVWLLGLSVVTVFTILLVVGLAYRANQASIIQATQAAQVTGTVIAAEAVPTLAPLSTPSVTPLPINQRIKINYHAGDFSLIRIEYPTHRPVTMVNGSGQNELATPAVGAIFAAVEFEFTCRLAICDAPPQARVDLRLADGNVVSYQNSSPPVLVEAPEVARIAENQMTSGWLVFEVPAKAVPDALLIVTGDQSDAPEYVLKWPN